jgi:cell division protein FtsN
MADRYQDRPFPADNYRGGNQAPSKGESDPLAELARLIGQTDPFAGLGGRANQQVQPRGNSREQFQPQPQLRPQPRPQPALESDDAPAGPPSWIQRAAAQQQPPHDLDADPHPAQRFAPEPPDRQAPQFAPEQQASTQQAPPQQASQFAPQQAPQFVPQQQAPQFVPQQQAPQFVPQQQAPQFVPQQQAPQFVPQQQAPQFVPQQQAPQFTPQQQVPSFSAAPDPHQRGVDPERYDEALYGQMPGASRDLLEEAEFDDPYAYQDEYGEGMVDQERPRRGGMFTVAVVLALAVVGTGAAFAYRAYVGSERNGDPPIIRADTGPNKMLPPTQSGDASGKLIQDRLTGGTERLVSREEQPIDLRDGKSGPRVIFPPLNQGANPPPTPSVPALNRPVANAGNSMSASTGTGIAANAAMAANTSNSPPAGASSSSANGAMGGDEPRKIRTVSVRGDQADAAGNPAAKPTATTRSVAPAAAPIRAQPVAASANAPMSITPQAGAAPADARTRMASTNAAAPPVEPVAVTSDGGGYVVQVSSQRNETDAQASFKSLQGKFPTMLGSREPMIKRADLGEKGVYYRAMVGPFGTPNEANQFCGSLKTAGGQCVVQRN